MELPDLIALIHATPDPAALHIPGYTRKESSRIVWIGPEYALKCDLPHRPAQNQREWDFYRRTPDRYRALLPHCYYLSPCTRYLIAEAVPHANDHLGRWLRIARRWPFVLWCWRQGLDTWELGKHDSWRFTRTWDPKLVDSGAMVK